MALAPGDTFGRYTIERTIGMGGMGQVLRAVDNVLQRTVALKIIRPDKSEREEAIARFFREARLAAQLTHPNTIRIYDLGEVDELPFIAMELIEGKPLSDHCGPTTTSTDATRKLRWLVGAARGLDAAHRHGMTHRDVKPANIMVAADDVAKVVDFGLAKRVKTTPELRATFNTALGFVVGTPIFMAPEQIEGDQVDARSDQFAWGLTAYALLSGENPRRFDPMLLDPITPIARRVPAVSGAASDIIMRALAADRALRHASMESLATELEDALKEPGPRVAAAPAPPYAPGSRVIVRWSNGQQYRASVLEVSAGRGCFVAFADGQRHWVDAKHVSPDHATWRFDYHADACPAAPLHVVAIARDGQRIVGFGAGGMVVHDSGAWRPRPTPPGFPLECVSCAAVLEDGSVVVGGVGLAMRILPTGDHEQWLAASGQHDVWLRGIEVTAAGTITFAGSRDSRGVVATLSRDGLSVADAPMPLHAIVTLSGHQGQLACGPDGALVSVRGMVMHPRTHVPPYNLMALAAFGSGALIVGESGVAMLAGASLETSLEAVDTSATLNAVTMTRSGSVWAASSRGLILERSADAWRRVTPSFGVEPNLLALWACDDRICAVGADGSRIVGSRR